MLVKAYNDVKGHCVLVIFAYAQKLIMYFTKFKFFVAKIIIILY